jgi:hypothetical protein
MDSEFSIDEAVFSVLDSILEARQQFFDIRFQRLLPHDLRASILSRYMLTDTAILEMMNRTYISNTQARNAAASLLTYTFTAANPTFAEPVVVAPTQAQIQACIESYVPSTQVSCAICQESVSSNAARIRHCGHGYHRSCILNWLSMSVRCPVCRHDVRETSPPVDQAAETSAVSSQT